MENLRDEQIPSSKNLMLLRLMLRHLLQFGISKNSLEISKLFLQSIKTYMAKRNLRIEYKKGFLDGAYKIMIFKNIKIVDKEVVIMDGHVAENSLMNGMKESVMLTSLLQSLFTNEEVLRAYLKVNKSSVLNIPGKTTDIPNIEPLARLMIELEQEEVQENMQMESDPFFEPVSSRASIEVESNIRKGVVTVLQDEAFNPAYRKTEPSLLRPSFKYREGHSDITVFLDPRAVLQFLNDSVKYMECLKQVRRVNQALMNQFEMIKQRISEVDSYYEENKRLENRERELLQQIKQVRGEETQATDTRDFSGQADFEEEELQDPMADSRPKEDDM